MDSLLQDIRYALRSLRKSRGTTFIAIACLALGIGANTAIFSVVKAVLLDALPYDDPSHLVQVNETSEGHGPYYVSPANFFDLQAQRRIFESMAAFGPASRDLDEGGEPERLRGIRASSSLFMVLGAQPIAGRTFLPADTLPGQPKVVVLSEQLWQRRFGAERSLIGSSIRLSGERVTVIGVMPARFDFPVTPTHNDFWVPIDWHQYGNLSNRMNHSIQGAVARLAPGLDSARATVELSTFGRRLEADYPNEQKKRGFVASTLQGSTVRDVRGALLLLLGAVGLVMLIACANVANLLLARAAGRRREIAIRTALGAARGRLVRQLITESVLLGFVGGVIGLAIARLLLAVLLSLAGTTLPRGNTVGLQGSVLAFALALSFATGILFGVVPAFRATRTDLRQDLSDAAGRSSAGADRHRLLGALIVGEIALSLMLLTGAGLIVRSFTRLLSTDPGFVSRNVLTFRTNAPSGRIVDSLRYAQFYEPVLERLRELPGVRAVGFTNLLPIQDGTTDSFISIVGKPVETDVLRRPDAQIRYVSSDYFRALRIPVVSGREISNTDDAGASPVMVVNEELVRRFLPGENPIGKQIDPGTGVPATIVGVVKSVHQSGLDHPAQPELYLAASQTSPSLGAITYVISASGDPLSLARGARDAVRAVAPTQPVYQLGTMDDVLSVSLQVRRLVLWLLGGFAALALVLSAAGVYGVMSYGVAQRTREIGIRMALGARGRTVASMVLSDVARVLGLGLVIGILGAAALTRVMSTLLFGVGTHDPATFAVVPAVIALVALAAGAIPALRAARVDPLIAMRAE